MPLQEIGLILTAFTIGKHANRLGICILDKYCGLEKFVRKNFVSNALVHDQDSVKEKKNLSGKIIFQIEFYHQFYWSS